MYDSQAYQESHQVAHGSGNFDESPTKILQRIVLEVEVHGARTVVVAAANMIFEYDISTTVPDDATGAEQQNHFHYIQRMNVGRIGQLARRAWAGSKRVVTKGRRDGQENFATLDHEQTRRHRTNLKSTVATARYTHDRM